MDLQVLKGLKKNFILMSMLELVGGLFMIVFSLQSLKMIVRLLGIVAAAYGVITFFSWLIKKDKSGTAGLVVTSILGVVAGVMLLLLYNSIMGVFTVVAGAFVGIFGVVKLTNMFSMKKAGFKKWWIILIFIGLIAGLGVLIGLNVTHSDQVNSILIGVALILGCAADIVAASAATEVEKQLLSAPEVDVTDIATTEDKK
ncbi:MAG: DUF308 domain-containing protein [Oscillospiraceae bacterium]